MSNVLVWVDPLIKDYQRTYRATFGKEAPRVTKRTAKGYIIHGSAGDSRLRSAKDMRRFIDWMKFLTSAEKSA